MTTETLVQPEYTPTNGISMSTFGVAFKSYRTGISRYTRISEDGQCEVRGNSRLSGYTAFVLGSGYILGASDMPRQFRSQQAAMMAAVRAAMKLRAR